MTPGWLRTASFVLAFVWLATAGSTSPFSAQVRDPGAPGAPAGGAAADATGVIRGVVTAASSGQPLGSAEVSLTGGRSKQGRFTRADALGRFEFTGVESGRYVVRAFKVGYVSSAYGQRLPSEPPANVELAASQTIDGLNIALFRQAVIVARVVDPYGDPVPGMLVQALQARVAQGENKLVNVSATSLFSTTDDRGEIRVYGLAPGEYYVTARRAPASALRDGRPNVQTEVYYPGTLLAAEAAPVTVGEGEEVPITLPLVSAGRATVTGRVTDSAGLPVVGASVQFMQQRVSGISSRPIAIAADGTFTATDVSPGDYVIQVRPGATGERHEYAYTPIRVDDGVDLTGLIVQTKPGATIRGRVVFDQAPAGARPKPGTLSITPVFTGPGGLSVGRLELGDDWSFTLTDVLGTGVLRVKGSAGWFLDRVRLGPQDVADQPVDFSEYEAAPVEVHLTRQQTRLTGHALTAQGQPTISYVVVAFAEDRRLWTPQSRYVAAARPDQNGRFSLAGLPPGRYHAIALNYLPAGAESDPRVLDRLVPQAVSLTLAAGEAREISFRIVDRY